MRRRLGNHSWSSMSAGISWLVVALVLVSGLSDELGWLLVSLPTMVADGERGKPMTEDSNPLGQSDPFEEDQETLLVQAPVVCLLRGHSRRLPTACGACEERSENFSRLVARNPDRNTPPASGRVLRLAIRSLVC